MTLKIAIPHIGRIQRELSYLLGRTVHLSTMGSIHEKILPVVLKMAEV